MESHVWQVGSRHDTSEGPISYQFCACGQHRVVASSGVEVAATPRPLGTCPFAQPTVELSVR